MLFATLIWGCEDQSKPIPPPEIFLQMPDGGFDLHRDSSFLIEPKITYDQNSTYEWMLNDELVHTEKNLLFVDQPLGTYEYQFNVTTPNGSDTMDIPVHALNIIHFEEFALLNEDGYHNSPENGLYDFKHALFSNYNPTGQSEDWSGFAISKNTNKTNSTRENEFSVYNTSGADGSKKFAVYKHDGKDHRISFPGAEEHKLKSIEVTNSTFTYLSMNSSLLFDKKQNKDFYKLTITGYNANNEKVGEEEFYLADYRPTVIAQKYLIATWKTVNLTSLGAVHSLGFELSSSVDNDPEKVFPKYFCLDNLKIAD